uniref:CSON005092 protein n=1 Tax=Culicoides sonorensis TaxID=179676 RepID=A0A336LUF9_CULSO
MPCFEECCDTTLNCCENFFSKYFGCVSLKTGSYLTVIFSQVIYFYLIGIAISEWISDLQSPHPKEEFHGNVYFIYLLDTHILFAYSISCVICSILLIIATITGKSDLVIPFLLVTMPCNLALIGIWIKSLIDLNLTLIFGMGILILVMFESWFCMAVYWMEMKYNEREIIAKIVTLTEEVESKRN